MKCNCCGHSSTKFLFSSHDYMYNNKKTEAHVYICTNCRLLTMNEIKICNKEVEEYPKETYYSYQNQSRFINYKVLLYKLFALNNRILNILLYPLFQFMRGVVYVPNGKVLDIGCGSGKFLNIIKNIGMIPHGVEISSELLKTLQTITPHVYIGAFENIDTNYFSSTYGKFDLILANHVIEHSSDPGLFIRKISSILANDGTAIIATPNYQSFYGLLFRKHWANLDVPRHKYILSIDAMNLYCKKHNLKLIKKRFLTNEFGFSGSIVYMIENILNRKIRNRTYRCILTLSRFLLFPFFTLLNIFRLGDVIEYHIKPINRHQSAQ